MQKINRRQFLTKGAIGAGAVIALSNMPGFLKAQGIFPMDMPIGFQSYAVREMLAKDFAGTLKTMAGFGYKLIEMCSPPGYAEGGFGFLVNTKAADIRKTINDAGLECPSCHFGFGEFGDKLDERIEFAHQMGLSQMICSTFWLPKTATLKDYEDSADKLNKAAEKIKSAGMQAGFHNHEMEFATLEGKLIYDVLMSRFDPALVKMQFQTEVINLGYKAADYFKKYPGRFISAHLSDWTADKKEMPIGKGVIDWKEFFAAVPAAGVKNIFVEMSFETFRDSATYLKSM